MLDYLRAESSTFLYVLGGVSCTLKYTFLSFIGGIVLGTFLAVLKVSPSVLARRAAQIYTSVFRGTPMLVQLSMILLNLLRLSRHLINHLIDCDCIFLILTGSCHLLLLLMAEQRKVGVG